MLELTHVHVLFRNSHFANDFQLQREWAGARWGLGLRWFRKLPIITVETRNFKVAWFDIPVASMSF